MVMVPDPNNPGQYIDTQQSNVLTRPAEKKIDLQRLSQGTGFNSVVAKAMLGSNQQPAASAAGGGGGGGGFAAPNEAKQLAKITDGTGNWSASQPYVTRDYAGLESTMRDVLQKRFQQQNLPPEYEAQGLSNINANYAATNRALQNKMASSGLYGGPVNAAGMGASEAARAGEISGFQNSLPMLQRALQNEDMTATAALMSAFGRGQGGYSNAVTKGGTVGGTPGTSGGGGYVDPNAYAPMQSPLSGAFGDLASTLTSLYGMGAFGGGGAKKQTGG